MNPFMKPLYQEFEENLYRLFGITLDEFRKFEADQGDNVDVEFASIFEKLGPLHSRSNELEDNRPRRYSRRTQNGQENDPRRNRCLAWTLGLNMVVFTRGVKGGECVGAPDRPGDNSLGYGGSTFPDGQASHPPLVITADTSIFKVRLEDRPVAFKAQPAVYVVLHYAEDNPTDQKQLQNL